MRGTHIGRTSANTSWLLIHASLVPLNGGCVSSPSENPNQVQSVGEKKIEREGEGARGRRGK
jgi:hypothetical protein